ncbi:MAG: hypothetical protein IJG84_23315 [Kiritimatiellae bacterium]|nr:hypothetical protein [Kiritimatiellia bacterium]
MPEQTNTNGTLVDEAYSASKKFLSSVLFVDDEIKMGERTGDGLSATHITDAFATESIVPSFYSCNHENQYWKILALIRKTDVFVLDWKMPVKRANAEENPDADADTDGDRGFFARKLIEALREDESLGPRLIFIYTSEFDEVVKYIRNLSGPKRRSEGTVETAALSEDSEAELSKDATDEIRPATGRNETLEWVSTNGNVRICAYFKESLKDNHGVDQSRVLTEAQLAEFVLKEYAKLHEGILPITLLRLLTTVRDNTRSLMAKFSARLDQAFVIDRAMTPEPLDADRMLVGMMLNSVAALNNEADMPWSNEVGLVGRWLRGKNISFGKLRLNNKETGIQDLVNWQSSGYKDFLLGTWPNGTSSEKKESEFKTYERFKFLKDVIRVFSIKGQDLSEVASTCRDYAVLSQWKRVAGSCRAIPVLTLGTVLKQKDKEEYYLCIQPSCDTYRVQSSGRDFLFLPLNVANEKFDIVLDGTGTDIGGLTISKDVYDLAKFNFKPLDATCDTVVKASKNEDGFYLFSSVDYKGNTLAFQWIGDIIETHALKIVHDYISKLGRVGIDVSEWLRRS